MAITTTSIRCVLQAALTGAITDNLRAVTVSFDGSDLILYFYYEVEPSEEEIDLSEIVSSEVVSDLLNINIDLKRIVLPISQQILDDGIWVYHRHE